jgi:3-phenylpropionate/trans-cinnamate dioxygenase ferredoxin subunit
VSPWTTVGTADGAPELQAVGEIAVARLADGSFAAFDDECTHEECPLSEGELESDRVVCYCHSSEFDVRTGAVLRGPATEPIQVYETRVADGELQVLAP